MIEVEVGIKNSGFRKGLESMRKDAAGFAKKIGEGFSFKTALSGLAGAFSIGAIGGALKSILDFGGALRDSADMVNLNVEALQELKFAFAQSGASGENVDKALVKLNDSLSVARGGNEAMIASFARLGVTWEDINRLSPDEVLMKMADGFKAAKNPGDALSAVLDTLGKTGAKLAPGLKEGSDAIRELRAAASKLSTEDVAALDAAGDKWSAFWNSIKVGAAKAALAILDVKSAADKVAPSGGAATGAAFMGMGGMMPVGTAPKTKTEAAGARDTGELFGPENQEEAPMSPAEKTRRKAISDKAEEEAKVAGEAMRGDAANKIEVDEHAEDTRLANQTRLNELKVKAYNLDEAAILATKSNAEQALFLRQRAYGLMQQSAALEKAGDAEGAVKKRIEAKELVPRIAALEKPDDKKPDEAQVARVTADSLTRIGGGGGIAGGGDPALQLQRQGLTLTREGNALLRDIAARLGGGGSARPLN